MNNCIVLDYISSVLIRSLSIISTWKPMLFGVFGIGMVYQCWERDGRWEFVPNSPSSRSRLPYHHLSSLSNTSKSFWILFWPSYYCLSPPTRSPSLILHQGHTRLNMPRTRLQQRRTRPRSSTRFNHITRQRPSLRLPTTSWTTPWRAAVTPPRINTNFKSYIIPPSG